MLPNYFPQREKNTTVVARDRKEISSTSAMNQTSIFLKKRITPDEIFIEAMLEYADHRNQFQNYDVLLEDWLVGSDDDRLKEKIQELQKELNSPYEKIMHLLESIKDKHIHAKNILDETQRIKKSLLENENEDAYESEDEINYNAEINYNYEEDEREKQNNIFLQSILFVPMLLLENFISEELEKLKKICVADLAEVILKEGFLKAKAIVEPTSTSSYSLSLKSSLAEYLNQEARDEIIEKATSKVKKTISKEEEEKEKQANSKKLLEFKLALTTSRLSLLSNNKIIPSVSQTSISGSGKNHNTLKI